MRSDTVTWTQTALDCLADVWLAASDRDQVAALFTAVDELLAEAPEAAGYPLREGLRVFESGNLRFLFAVRDADRVAEVVFVRATG
jgi:plasmid stabilization system protein ParE